jgi:mannose-6-phosphate isomerase
MFRLENVIQAYAWGSTRAIAALQGRAPSESPEAELWLGAHPKAPSRLADTGQGLDAAIAQDPTLWLGPAVAARFGGELPFLLKALAAGTPLSLQAHPSIPQAIAGFAADDAAGIPLDAPHRNYRDKNHKPELICALTEFAALCGFRPLDESRALFEQLSVAAVAPYLQSLFDVSLPPDQALKATFAALMSAPRAEQVIASRAVAAAASELRKSGRAPTFAGSLFWAVRLFELYPGDIGVVSSLLLNQVTLQPGEALYLAAGNLHAYLEGFGIELMANSDNVLRGGCTPKHVDVAELLKVLDFSSGSAEVLRPKVIAPGIAVYPTPAPEFELSELRVEGRLDVRDSRPGPEILLVTEGRVELTSSGVGGERARLLLNQGQSAFVRPEDQPYTLEGVATVFRAAVGSAN